jgi:hypothetical protein
MMTLGGAFGAKNTLYDDSQNILRYLKDHNLMSIDPFHTFQVLYLIKLITGY